MACRLTLVQVSCRDELRKIKVDEARERFVVQVTSWLSITRRALWRWRLRDPLSSIDDGRVGGFTSSVRVRGSVSDVATAVTVHGDVHICQGSDLIEDDSLEEARKLVVLFRRLVQKSTKAGEIRVSKGEYQNMKVEHAAALFFGHANVPCFVAMIKHDETSMYQLGVLYTTPRNSRRRTGTQPKVGYTT